MPFYLLPFEARFVVSFAGKATESLKLSVTRSGQEPILNYFSPQYCTFLCRISRQVETRTGGIREPLSTGDSEAVASHSGVWEGVIPQHRGDRGSPHSL